MKRVRLISVAAAVVLVLACLSGCGEGNGGESARPLATADPAAAFAPLVRLHPREDTFPMSARYFLSHSGLEWMEGSCGSERDITLSAVPEADAKEEPLDIRRLGSVPGYEARGLAKDCKTPRGEVYSTALRTRLFDTEDRPRDLGLTEGFALDIASDAQDGQRRIGADGALAGVPAYYALERENVGGTRGLRVSYWLLYGNDKRGYAEDQIIREGDWERLDVILESVGRDRYRAKRIRLHSKAGVEPASWDEIEHTGPDDAHPVVYAQRRTHGLRLTGDCRGRCTDWRTWDRLTDVRGEPWYGYAGGWGAAVNSGSAERAKSLTGPIGPTPYELGPAPSSP
jgi:hypothetical protein